MADSNNGKQNGSTKDGGMNQCPACGAGMMGRGCGCGCGSCGGGWQGSCHRGFGWGILRVIIALVVLGIVFSVGMMVGELRAFVGGYMGGRSPMMRSYGYQVGGSPMMNLQGGTMPTPTATSTAGY